MALRAGIRPCRGRRFSANTGAQPQARGPGGLQLIVRHGLPLIRLPTPSVFHLHTFQDAEVAFPAGAECLKRLFVSLGFVSGAGDVVAVEFDKDRPLLQSGFVNLHLAHGPCQKAPPE